MKQITIFIIVMTLLLGCKKTNTTTTQQSNTTKVLFYCNSTVVLLQNVPLFVDGVNKGNLKYSSIVPDCNATGFIVLDLSNGNHTVETPSLNGNAGNNRNIFVQQQTDCQRFNIVP
jgi:hypothetical protein